MSEISIALGGGGIKGIAHVGVLRVLERAGYHIQAVSGTSAGGIVGALYAAGHTPDMIEQLISTVDQKTLFKRGEGEGPSLLGLSSMVEILGSALGDIDFSELKIPFACTAVDLNTAQEIIINQGSVLDAVLATIAIPGVFPPKEIHDYRLVDGGIMDPVPVALARHLCPTLPVIAVCLSPSPEKWSHLPSPIQLSSRVRIPASIVEQFSRLRISQALQIFTKSMEISSRTLAELRLQVDKPEIIIRPELAKFTALEEVDPDELITIGEAAALQTLPAIDELFSWRNRLTRKVIRKSAPVPGKLLSLDEENVQSENE